MILDPSNIAISDPPNEEIDIWPEIDLYLRARWQGGKSVKSLPDRMAANRAKYSSSLLRPISLKLSEDLACRQRIAVSACMANSSAENILPPSTMHRLLGGSCLQPIPLGRCNWSASPSFSLAGRFLAGVEIC